MNINKSYSSLSNGIQELTYCKKVSSSYSDWKEDIPWLSLYFTFSVWASIIILKWVEKFKKIK
jgi:hypothetical protein